MNHLNVALKISVISQIVISLFLIFLPLGASYAKAGCCSRHGGVAGCNSATGYQQCKDGSTSPSCACEGGKANVPVKPVKAVTLPAKAPATTTSTTTNTVATPAATTPASKAKTAGCCSRHGGVDHCDKSTGYQVCKDSTQSTTCKCS